MIVRFNAPKLHLRYEAHRTGRLRINSYHLAIVNVRRNLDTLPFSLFVTIRKMAAATGTARACYRAQHHNALTTEPPRRDSQLKFLEHVAYVKGSVAATQPNTQTPTVALNGEARTSFFANVGSLPLTASLKRSDMAECPF